MTYLGDDRSDAPDHPSEATPHESEELNHVPEFAKLMEPLFKDLLQVYQTPALYHALQCANKMFLDVENGRAVDPNDVMEACRFRFALEMARVKLNMQIPETTNKVLKDMKLLKNHGGSLLHLEWFNLVIHNVRLVAKNLTSCSISLLLCGVLACNNSFVGYVIDLDRIYK